MGFIQKLPTQLVAAFRATLEEMHDAALILHVVDISHKNAAIQANAVTQVLLFIVLIGPCITFHDSCLLVDFYLWALHIFGTTSRYSFSFVTLAVWLSGT